MPPVRPADLLGLAWLAPPPWPQATVSAQAPAILDPRAVASTLCESCGLPPGSSTTGMFCSWFPGPALRSPLGGQDWAWLAHRLPAHQWGWGAQPRLSSSPPCTSELPLPTSNLKVSSFPPSHTNS